MKSIVFDIETTHTILANWSLFDKYTSHENILSDWHVISVAWKELGKGNPVQVVYTYTKNDKKVIQTIKKVLESADEVIYHNGDDFDYKKLNARALYHRLGPIPKVKSVDTLKQARKHFRLTSNRLDYIAKFLGVGGKIKTDNALWLRVLAGEKKAVDEMVYYNRGDVELEEKIYNILVPYMDSGVNRGLIDEYNKVCPRCTSPSVSRRGYFYTTTGKYQRYKCASCHGWSHGGQNMKEKTAGNLLR
jgi:DNA polymerase elongation subunit (family B)